MLARALHFVLKIPKRNEAINFYKQILGMKVLRHEEFHEGCKASCNGPYDGKWSKTMIGYGAECSHFVLELTYNYGVSDYRHGNDFRGIHINSPDAFNKLKATHSLVEQATDDCLKVIDPAGYTFFVYNKSTQGDPIWLIELAVSNLTRSLEYWSKKLEMSIVGKGALHFDLCYCNGQCQVRITHEKQPIDRGSAFGRIAFSCPRERLSSLQERMDSNGATILTRLVSLDTPGKESVFVVILGDPDGHEICFVGDEAFRNLSQEDPNAEELLAKAVATDDSEEWFKKRGGKKQQC